MTLHLTEEEFNRLFGSKGKSKRNKYNAQKITIDGKTFDSKLEAEYYTQLLILKKAGVITDFECQKPFILQEGFTREGKKYSAIKYYADFVVTYSDGREEVVDTKGHKTSVYKLKKKLLLAKYPNIIFKEISKYDKELWA